MTVYLAKSSKRYGKVSMGVALKWARRQLSEMIPWNMAEGVDGIPDLGVGQGKKKVVSQRLNENEFALPQPPKKRCRHLPLATETVSSSSLQPLWEFPCSVQRTAVDTPHRPRLLCFGQLAKLNSSYLRHFRDAWR